MPVGTFKKFEISFDMGGFCYMVFLNPQASTLKVWKVFCLDKDFLLKSILTGFVRKPNAREIPGLLLRFFQGQNKLLTHSIVLSIDQSDSCVYILNLVNCEKDIHNNTRMHDYLFLCCYPCILGCRHPNRVSPCFKSNIGNGAIQGMEQ